MKKKAITFFGVFLGALTGLGIGLLGKCSGGMCPLTREPVVPLIIGGVIGGLISHIRNEKRSRKDQGQ